MTLSMVTKQYFARDQAFFQVWGQLDVVVSDVAPK
jgi:hypothetical protein